jgi:hypothetical protein
VDRDALDVQYIGEWWLPSTLANRARGTLVVGAGDRATLSLEPGESLGPIPGGGSPIVKEFSFCLRETYAVVLGEAYEISADKQEHQRCCLTLGNCCVESGASSQKRSVSYSIGVVVAGDIHMPSLQFNELHFDIPNLAEAFPGNEYFRSSYSPDLAQLSTGVPAFAAHRVVQRWLLRSGVAGKSSTQPDTEIHFVHDIEMGHPATCTTSLTDKYRLTLRFRSRKRAWSIGTAQWFWERFSQFFWLVTGLRPACRHVTATVNDSSRLMTFQIHSYQMVGRSVLSSDMSANPDVGEHALFTVSQIASRDIGFLWPHWDFLYLGLSDVLLLRGIGRQLSQRGHFDEALLLDVAALESLHQVWIPPDSQGRDKARREGVKTGNKVVLAYVTRLAHQYVPELRIYAAALSLATSDYRNYVAHHSVDAKKTYEAWPHSLMEVMPRFCDFLLDMTLLDRVGSEDWRHSPRTSDQTRMAKKHAAHPEYASLVHYMVRELDEWSSKSSEME